MHTFLDVILLVVIVICQAVESQSCGKPAIAPLTSSRIVGGAIARKGSWPWQVSIGMRQQSWFGTSIEHICGGSIVDNYFIITAAHCVTNSDVSKYVVRAGKHDRTMIEDSESNHEVSSIVLHEDYSSSSDENDIALIELATPLEYIAEISPVCLPPAGSDPPAGSVSWVVGWGEINPQEWRTNRGLSSLLKQATLPIISRATCLSYYPGLISDKMICAGYENGGQDACQADSGGPLVQKNNQGAFELTGIISWGYGCAMAKQPGVYIRTGAYVSWINNTLKNAKLQYSQSEQSVNHKN